jgi:protein-disulfide isomerase
MSIPLARALGLSLAAAALSCTPPAPPEPPKTEPAATAVATATAAPAPEQPVPVPVTAADPSWGSAEAPVTIVAFSDFECPFCDRVRTTLEELKEAYGPEKLRVVWKNHPLPFHKNAAGAARAAHAVFLTHGNDAFWSAHHALFNRQRILADASEQLLERARAKQADLGPTLAAADAKIAGDAAVVKASGITGAPAFYINGLHLSGAQPTDKFKAIIDEQLTKAAALVQRGVAPGKVYAELTRAQWTKVERPVLKLGSMDKDSDVDSRPMYALPTGKSPSRGPADALVTMVLATDLRCANCAQAANAVAEAMAADRKNARLVVKFQRASGKDASDAALHLAIEARTKKGDTGFWKVYDALRAETTVDDAALERAAAAAGLPVKVSMQAVRDRKHKAVIDADEEALVDATVMSGVLFMNGHPSFAPTADMVKRQLAGEIAAAQKLVDQGTARAKVYDKIQEGARPPRPFERKEVPPPGKDTAGRGPADAKVVVQLFGNFESGLSQQMFWQLSELDPDLAGKVRIVMRHLPLPVQPASPLAAEAAVEAFTQKGDAGFWAMATAMFTGRDHIDGLDRPALVKYAASAGLHAGKMGEALDSRAHKAAVAADAAIAKQAGITGPVVIVHDVVLPGASAPRLRKTIRQALAEAK